MRYPLRGLSPRSRVPTQRLLLTHLLWLLALTMVTTIALPLAYQKVHVVPDVMRTSMAPAVQDLAATQASLRTADEAVKKSAQDEALTKVVGAGEEYRTQVSAADQNLSRLADRQFTGDYGRSSLEAVNGLLTVYSDSIAQSTGKYADDGPMRDQKRKEAESILTRDGVGILPRLSSLRRNSFP